MIHKLKELYRGATPIQSLVTYYALATVAAFIFGYPVHGHFDHQRDRFNDVSD